ncbi:hydrogenase formation protein HypD [bacterium]|nr:hydrogenase formation protein HypD [bacterium]MBU1983992.1 hydrogenase formation protein HypD [bacterium]
MKVLTALRNADAVRHVAREIAEVKLDRTVRLMEVCGGHTAAIYRFALRDLLPEWVELVSGPGCPVCVTANDFVDRSVALARQPNVTIATFGDLIRVPGSSRSLAEVRAEGGDVRVFYSSADALDWAIQHPERIVVFLGIGFETTACTLAATLKSAVQDNARNFRLLSSLKTMPPALSALFSAPDVKVDGLILPGHVTTVIGTACYEFIPSEFNIPCVVSGFEPLDLMETILKLCQQLAEARASVENQYRRVVHAEGNPQAQVLMDEMFEPADVPWRGFGVIPGSGLAIRREFADWDAERIPVEVEPTREHAGCRCGEVLRGALHPTECPLFGKSCTPDTPRGACMVSAEGACAAVYHFSPVEHG